MSTISFSQRALNTNITPESPDLISPEVTFCLRLTTSKSTRLIGKVEPAAEVEEESSYDEDENSGSSGSTHYRTQLSQQDIQSNASNALLRSRQMRSQDTENLSEEENAENMSETEMDESYDDDDDDDETGVGRRYHLSDFKKLKTVGTGSFGRVFLCKDKKTKRYVAMKILAMADVIRLKQVEHVINERNILAELNNPFMISLEWSTKDSSCLYLIFEYVSGGELFSYIKSEGKLKPAAAKFYAAEIALGLSYLHSRHIVYRDLKPENILLAPNGHVKLIDFGLSKKLHDRTYTLCGTPEYLAPEILQHKGYNKAVDWWALGILIFEMLTGEPPFQDKDLYNLYEKIMAGKLTWPKKMDPIAKNLIKKLLHIDRTKRLGNMKNGADDIKSHRWFDDICWTRVHNQYYTPPYRPKVRHAGDTSNFDRYSEKNWKPAKLLNPDDIDYFKDF